MTTEKLEEIKGESKIHSANLTDWTTEALLKELCWGVYHDSRTEEKVWCWRVINSYQELSDRINNKYGPLSEEFEPFKCSLVLSQLRDLIEAQENCSISPMSPKKHRNEILREIEGALKVRTIIADILLP